MLLRRKRHIPLILYVSAFYQIDYSFFYYLFIYLVIHIYLVTYLLIYLFIYFTRPMDLLKITNLQMNGWKKKNECCLCNRKKNRNFVQTEMHNIILVIRRTNHPPPPHP